jgi:FAD:protein FMN transferase
MQPCLKTLLVLLLTLTASLAHAERFDYHHENVFGTSFHLQIEADNREAADTAETKVLAEIDRLAAIVSSYDSCSELSKFQSLPIGNSMKLSKELFELLSECDRWTTASNGAFNPAVETISQEWKKAAAANTLPNTVTLASLVEQVSGMHWELDAASHQATRRSSLPISLNAIATGYVLDQVVEQLAIEKVNGVLVDIGGDIRVAGKIEANISIADPQHDSFGAPPLSIQSISNAGITTSGNSERGFEIQHTKYSHLIDPRTGMPVTDTVSATVFAPTACTADALATICSVMSIQGSLKLVEATPGAACMLISSTGKVFKSKNWPHELASPKLPLETKLVNFRDKETEPQMVIEFEIKKAENAGRYRRPYVAIWIEDKDGFPVKTLLLFLMKNQPGPRWHRDLRRWYANDQMRLLVDKADIIDAVSKPTRNPGKYKVEWDGLDDAGKPLKDGEYTLFIEAAREHGTYQLMKHKFDVGGKPFEETLKGNAEISSASLKYKATPN